MALSGNSALQKLGTANSNALFRWSATQNLANNTSTVTVKAYAQKIASGSYFILSKDKLMITIDGSSSAWLDMPGIANSSSIPINTDVYQNEWSRTITHAADGTKTFNMSVRFWHDSNPSSFDITISLNSVVLDAIPKGVVWIGNTSNVATKGTVYIGNASGIAVVAKEIYIGNSSGVAVKAKTS